MHVLPVDLDGPGIRTELRAEQLEQHLAPGFQEQRAVVELQAEQVRPLFGQEPGKVEKDDNFRVWEELLERWGLPRSVPGASKRLGTLEHLPVSDAEADAMVGNMVLHHVGNPPDALREVHRGLRAGGRFLLADLSAHHEESYRERLGDLWLGFERRDLERWLEEAEFDLESIEELRLAEGRPSVLLLTARRRVPN